MTWTDKEEEIAIKHYNLGLDPKEISALPGMEDKTRSAIGGKINRLSAEADERLMRSGPGNKVWTDKASLLLLDLIDIDGHEFDYAARQLGCTAAVARAHYNSIKSQSAKEERY